MSNTSPNTAPNLFELKPRRTIEWLEEEGRMILLVPKFRNKFLGKWLVPLLRTSHFRVKLDQHGGFMWKQCDGETTVSTIAERMNHQFGASAVPWEDRIAVFIGRLETDGFLSTKI